MAFAFYSGAKSRQPVLFAFIWGQWGFFLAPKTGDAMLQGVCGIGCPSLLGLPNQLMTFPKVKNFINHHT